MTTMMTQQEVQTANNNAAAAYRAYCVNQNEETFAVYKQASEICEQANRFAQQAGFIDEIGIASCILSIR